MVLLLLSSLLAQPINQAFAADETIDNETSEEEVVVAEPVIEQEVLPEVLQDDNDNNKDDEISLNDTDLEAENISPEQDDENLIVPNDEDINSDSSEEVTGDDEEVSMSTSSDEIAETPTTPNDEVSTTTSSDISNASTTIAIENVDTSSTTSTTTSDVDQNAHTSSGNSGNNPSDTTDDDDDVVETDATATSTLSNETEDDSDTDDEIEIKNSTTTEIAVVETQYLVTENNFYQFSKQSCVAVGDGTYHCSSNALSAYDTQAVVYADLGANGNMEIFLRTSKGDVQQITDNEFDDTAPFYDAESLRVVWQRLIDGRYQIILYDIEENEESQLTFSRTNNMEPKVSNEGIVWQAWDNNDWEIMYFDGRYTDQITDNLSQDVTPVIEDGYILWSVIGSEEQEAKVYSLESNETLTISGHDGGSIANPRFVLVYDTKFDNGDVITHGFDPATGLSAPISAKAAPEPIEIPQSDPIGEIRALIQNKSTDEDELDTDQLGVDKDTASTSKTSDIDGTLDLKNPDNSASSTPSIVVKKATTSDVVSFELTDYDLVLSTEKVVDEERGDLSISSTTSTQE